VWPLRIRLLHCVAVLASATSRRPFLSGRSALMSAAQISELVGELGGLSAVLGAATGAERAQVYASLALRLDYDPYLRRVRATADLSRVAGCVRGGT
jgi:site-specific DNA recombinase